MTAEVITDFPKKVMESYILERENMVLGRMVRMTKKSLSEQFEDYFAMWCDGIIPADIPDVHIYVNPTLRKSDEKGKAKAFRPDVCIVKGNKILQMWDLKTDLGYMRDGLPGIVANHSNEAQPKTVKNVSKNLELEIEPGICYYTLIVSLLNGDKTLKKEIERLNLEYKNAPTLYIFEHYHPNENFTNREEDKQKALAEAAPRMDEIKKLILNLFETN